LFLTSTSTTKKVRRTNLVAITVPLALHLVQLKAIPPSSSQQQKQQTLLLLPIMAQRTTMRVSLAQLMAMRDNARQSSQAPVAPAVEPTDTIYYVTAHITVVNNGGFVYHVAFGPNRSRSTTMEALTHIFPRVESFFEGLPGPVPMDDRNNHFRWTENNGDEVLVRIEHNKNPTVCASGPGQEHFGVIHRVTDYNFSPISERADIVG